MEIKYKYISMYFTNRIKITVQKLKFAGKLNAHCENYENYLCH
jgi:hypothetical protein